MRCSFTALTGSYSHFRKFSRLLGTLLCVIPPEEEIQEFWMLDRVQHDKARANADFFQSGCPRRERVGSFQQNVGEQLSFVFRGHQDRNLSSLLCLDESIECPCGRGRIFGRYNCRDHRNTIRAYCYDGFHVFH